MKKITFLLTILLVFATACKNEKKEPKEVTRMERVIAVHDEMMPKMGTLGSLINKLKPKVDSSAVGKQYKAAQDDLEDAYNYMMDWMKGFGERFDSDEIMKGKALSKEKKALLIEEEQKVNIMRNKINQSIANAEALLKKENKD
jgi:hypothetical protein